MESTKMGGSNLVPFTMLASSLRHVMCLSSFAKRVIHQGSGIWIEKARRNRPKKCAFLLAKSYGPGLRVRLH